jgi:hypothetical protein
MPCKTTEAEFDLNLLILNSPSTWNKSADRFENNIREKGSG